MQNIPWSKRRQAFQQGTGLMLSRNCKCFVRSNYFGNYSTIGWPCSIGLAATLLALASPSWSFFLYSLMSFSCFNLLVTLANLVIRLAAAHHPTLFVPLFKSPAPVLVRWLFPQFLFRCPVSVPVLPFHRLPSAFVQVSYPVLVLPFPWLPFVLPKVSCTSAHTALSLTSFIPPAGLSYQCSCRPQGSLHECCGLTPSRRSFCSCGVWGQGFSEPSTHCFIWSKWDGVVCVVAVGVDVNTASALLGPLAHRSFYDTKATTNSLHFSRGNWAITIIPLL